MWFCEEIQKSGIKFLNVYTVESFGDMFKEGLTRATFGYLCKKIIVWKFYPIDRNPFSIGSVEINFSFDILAVWIRDFDE